MEAQYSEIVQNNVVQSENKEEAKKTERNIKRSFGCAFVGVLIFICGAAFCFSYNNIYEDGDDWIISHEVVGTYGDFIGGTLGVLVAIYSTYLLVKTLGNQLSINGDMMDTNQNIVSTNKITIYQTNLQIFDNKFHTFFDNYKSAKLNYRSEKEKVKKKIIVNSGVKSKTVEEKEIVVKSGVEAVDIIARLLLNMNYSDRRTYLSRVKSATRRFEEFYASHRREMSVHFRNLYLLAKLVGETCSLDEEYNWVIKDKDRVEYAKSIRGQLSEGEMILLRYNCLTSRGEKMRPFVNQFNFIKHMPVMSLFEFKKHRSKLNSDREANALDSHYVELKKRIRDFVGFADDTSEWTLSVKYSIIMNLTTDKKHFTLTIRKLKKRPASGSDGIPPIEKALNCFTKIEEVTELYKDFIREALIVSNFYLYNGRKNTNVVGKEKSDGNYDKSIIEYVSSYPIVINVDL